ncbi:hypothetical protein CDD81_4621 [Ophiocordyceps australis]|uniref:Dol-P-Glc:Glc(2)Man(9)GlcNAc(2)-PP-Dol alpha-1,2-glucosyltransferase n=1 Tax=Ophiocordyceps australis TaxID=1399860 RepID=A0A2C5YAA8_9HYPO|nr:hypothetical protein CDD81_4621 [Ophiocordyceps australis]
MAANGGGASSPSSARGMLGINVAYYAAPLAFAIHIILTGKYALPHGPLPLLLLAIFGASCFLWYRGVSMTLSDPYLDEVFHIPQAQKYCEGRFREWDDKLTTPPGLYFLSMVPVMALKLLGFSKWESACSASGLRAFNALGLLAVGYLVMFCRWRIEQAAFTGPARLPISEYAFHTAVNILLFPLLFFFSGLYYTDVVSTAVVAGALLNHLGRVARSRTSWASDLLTIVLGVLALLMRQTNIFFVVVYMGGLEAIHAVKTPGPDREHEPCDMTLWQQLKFLGCRYSMGHVHDLPLGQAWPDDALLTAISLGIAVICNPLRVLRHIWPHLTVLAIFGVFVAWNGGVVLGDKTNHVATMHLAQMLYIWPLFAFFSLPLFLPMPLYVIRAFKAFTRGSSKAVTVDSVGKEQRNQDESILSRQTEITLEMPAVAKISTWLTHLVGTTALSALVVRYNTIIHPFTLADNRHFMFYIFRYTIRRGLLIRYLLILPYTLCRFLVWGALAGYSDWSQGPWQTCSSHAPIPRSSAPLSRSTKPLSSRQEQAYQSGISSNSLTYSTAPVHTSTALVFLAATSLSLVTAPLVEPRYFIVPWLLWRLLVPAWRADYCAARLGRIQGSRHIDGSLTGRVTAWLAPRDARLCLETAWFVAINFATCYVFITRPFVWKAEDGTILHGGQLQRFMW